MTHRPAVFVNKVLLERIPPIHLHMVYAEPSNGGQRFLTSEDENICPVALDRKGPPPMSQVTLP